MPPTPIAIFTYNRPVHTQHMFDSLEACRRLEECEVVIYGDGVKKPEHAAAVRQTREVVQAWAEKHGAKVVLRDENYGLAKSITTGVTELCEQYGRVIVLEDDLVLAPAFLDYMLVCLDHYADDERIMQISGYTFPFEDNPPPGLFLQPVATTWGWATWKRAWDQYDHDTQEALAILKNPQQKHSFDLDGAYPYTRMYRHAAAGKVDSWGVRWWFSVWQQEGLVVYSRQTLVNNEGFDGSGVHSGEGKGWAQSIAYAQLPERLDFPQGVDQKLAQRYFRYIAREVAPTKPSRWNKLKQVIRRKIRAMGRV